MRKPKQVFLPVLILTIVIMSNLFAQTAASPEKHFGFQMGTDRKLIDWKQITAYFDLLSEKSDRLLVRKLGETTLGRPYIMAIISSAENIDKLPKYQEIQHKLANPYDLTEHDAKKLVKNGKAVIMLNMNIHSTEIGSSQESVELAWELAFSQDERIRKILDQVIILLIPSANPDGQQMVTDWYRKYVGTEYEGCRLPWLYHHYAGHDNNRDWFLFNLQESRLLAPILYKEWYPEIIFDQHQMGSSGPRMYLPPYSDPVNLNVHPELMAEVNMLGKHVISDLHDQGFKGITSAMGFNAYFEGTMSKTPLWHNMVGILSEMASVNLASPKYFPRGSLGTWGPERLKYNQRSGFLDPWKGGWWRLRNIIEYEKAATFSILELTATYKEKFMLNFFRLNKKSLEQGKSQPPYAYIIPDNQHDPGSAEAMLKKLELNGIKIYKSSKPLFLNNRVWENSFIIPLSQPCRPCIKDLFEKQAYPDLKSYPGGPPKRPYDFAGWTVPLQMGVQTIPVMKPLDIPLELVTNYSFITLKPLETGVKYIYFDRRNNNAYGLVNDLVKAGVDIFWINEKIIIKDRELPQGTFFVKGNESVKIWRLAEKWQVPLSGGPAPASPSYQLKTTRLAIYQPWTANMDEGWTRLVLDNFHYSYQVIHNSEIKKGQLNSKFDAIILPAIRSHTIAAGRDPGGRPGYAKTPLKYCGGLGRAGAAALKKFVNNGGTLITIGSSCDYTIEQLHLPVENVLKNVSTNEFFIPGSLLEMTLDLENPLSWGMPEKIAVRFANHPAFRLRSYNRQSTAVGFYQDHNPLLSGWLIGDKLIAGQTALAEIPVNKGRVILFGFGVQSRAQTSGTFKLLFNAILTSNVKTVLQ